MRTYDTAQYINDVNHMAPHELMEEKHWLSKEIAKLGSAIRSQRGHKDERSPADKAFEQMIGQLQIVDKAIRSLDAKDTVENDEDRYPIPRPDGY